MIRVRSSSLPGAFSMLETAVAVALLGIGLIMVASIFPVALTQHKNSADQSTAMDLSVKADAILKARVNTNQLYPLPADPAAPPPGVDSPWYLLPIPSIATGATTWDPMFQPQPAGSAIYANLISGFDNLFNPTGLGNFPDYLAGGNQFGLLGSDYLDVKEVPYTDEELQADPHHFVWYGLYRRLGTGTVRFGVIVCKQRRGAAYAEQDMSSRDTGLIASMQTPFATPLPLAATRRLPVPWRVTIGYEGGHRLSNRQSGQMFGATGSGIGSLAPAGSKLLIQGQTYTNPSTDPVVPVPAGRLLTVSSVVSVNTIEVLEDISDLPGLNFTSGQGSAFDVWLIPPTVESGVAGNDSPALLWRMTL